MVAGDNAVGFEHFDGQERDIAEFLYRGMIDTQVGKERCVHRVLRCLEMKDLQGKRLEFLVAADTEYAVLKFVHYANISAFNANSAGFA
jgi:hypothetical protein